MTTYQAEIKPATTEDDESGYILITAISDKKPDTLGEIATYGLRFGADIWSVLTGFGWRPTGFPESDGDIEYVSVEIGDPEKIVYYLHRSVFVAEVEVDMRREAWKFVLVDAKNKGASTSKLAKASDISPRRVHQIMSEYPAGK